MLLDPLVRMHRIDESDAGQVAEILDELRQLQRNHHTAICVVHHARKNGPGGNTGLALRGSVDFYAWADALMIMQRRRDRLQLSIEHRTAPSPPALPLVLAGEGDSVHLELVEREQSCVSATARPHWTPPCSPRSTTRPDHWAATS